MSSKQAVIKAIEALFDARVGKWEYEMYRGVRRAVNWSYNNGDSYRLMVWENGRVTIGVWRHGNVSKGDRWQADAAVTIEVGDMSGFVKEVKQMRDKRDYAKLEALLLQMLNSDGVTPEERERQERKMLHNHESEKKGWFK